MSYIIPVPVSSSVAGSGSVIVFGFGHRLGFRFDLKDHFLYICQIAMFRVDQHYARLFVSAEQVAHHVGKIFKFLQVCVYHIEAL